MIMGMITLRRNIHGFMVSSRLALLPTLLTNAMVAWVIMTGKQPQHNQWQSYAIIVVTGLCYYLYGMWENDRVDARWDARHRPNKPIPRGDISLMSLRVASMIAGASALILTGLQLSQGTTLGLGLLFIIIFYNWLHKHRPEAIILMGICRGGWVFLACALAFVATTGGNLTQMMKSPQLSLCLYYTLSLTLYTTVTTGIARGESHSNSLHQWAFMLLAGMCIHDAIWLAYLSSWGIASAALGCFVLIPVLRRTGQSAT